MSYPLSSSLLIAQNCFHQANVCQSQASGEATNNIDDVTKAATIEKIVAAFVFICTKHVMDNIIKVPSKEIMKK